MPDGEFDGIIIGSGYNGLTLGGVTWPSRG